MNPQLIIGTVYKVFDNKNKGIIVHSAAKLETIDECEVKFRLINRSTEQFVSIPNFEIINYTFIKSNYIPKL